MESWRAFRLVEEEGPEYKEDPKDTIALLKALSTESDIQRKEKAIRQILADKDVAEVIKALGEMFQEITSEEDIEVDIDEGLDDLGRAIAGHGLNLTAKVEEFLSSTPAGRVLGTIAPPLLGLALGVLMIQGGDTSATGLKTVGKLVSGKVNPQILGDVVMDLGAEALEGIQERKKI